MLPKNVFLPSKITNHYVKTQISGFCGRIFFPIFVPLKTSRFEEIPNTHAPLRHFRDHCRIALALNR